ncbi:MAG: hypothetical protein KDA83_20550, partial [Planctomycetales bacterium]|nr:hypothetical protein [Planctomycetales bacterium]
LSVGLILCDVLRRSGQFDKSAALASELAPLASDPLLSRIATFQATICRTRDDSVHTLDEVP